MVATLVLTAALGVLMGWLIFAPDTPDGGSVDAGFARDMSEHHGQAVDMSLIVLQESDDPGIDVLAYDIATTQSTQIGTMQGWLDQWGLPSARSEPRMSWMAEGAMTNGEMGSPAEPGEPDYRPMPGMASPAEMEGLRAATSTDSEILFLQLMITHHLAGVDMAQAAVDRADDPEVTRQAEAMVNGQRRAIDLMTALLRERD
ncbi:MAG: DUF305 domain-containing protein, partial [Ornithinimicrobium sp.]